MSRSRNIKPGFFENEILASMPYEHRLLFIGLWTLADRDGRFEDRPTRIKMKLFAADGCDVNAGLQALHNNGFILRYEVDGSRYCQVLAWAKHQSPHFREKKSTIPAPVMPQAFVAHDEPKASGTSEASPNVAALIPDSLIPDSKELPPTAAEIADPIFGTGLDFLKRKGLAESPARSFLGLLRKELRDDLTVAELLVEAERQDVSDPAAWLRAAAKNRKAQARAGPQQTTSKTMQGISALEGMKHAPRHNDTGTVVQRLDFERPAKAAVPGS